MWSRTSTSAFMTWSVRTGKKHVLKRTRVNISVRMCEMLFETVCNLVYQFLNNFLRYDLEV
jgi:hypothetical protein